MKLSIELDIEIDYEDIEDEGDELTAPYSATRIDYDRDYVLRQVETKLREELHYIRTERREKPLTAIQWMLEEWIGQSNAIDVKATFDLDMATILMKQYAEYRLMKGQ